MKLATPFNRTACRPKSSHPTPCQVAPIKGGDGGCLAEVVGIPRSYPSGPYFCGLSDACNVYVRRPFPYVRFPPLPLSLYPCIVINYFAATVRLYSVFLFLFFFPVGGFLSCVYQTFCFFFFFVIYFTAVLCACLSFT